MSQKQIRVFVHFVLAAGLVSLGSSAAWGQQAAATGGNLSVTVLDPSGAAVPNASLDAKDLSTNVTTHGTTLANGVYTFLNLPGGTYSLKVAAQGFASQSFESVLVRTSLETDVKATLKIGSATESVTVTATEAPLVQTESSTIATNIDTKQVFNLPDITRDVFGLAQLVPGYAGGTYDNMPSAAIISATVDGTTAMSNRFRDGTQYGQTVVQFRMENISEFTVTTSQLDLSGAGNAAMGISAVYKRGTNQFHGMLYEDFRNTILNANTWLNNANVNANGVGTARTIQKYNQFGGTLGGPIIKNKLFFYGDWSMEKYPSTSIASATYINPSAQQGLYQFIGTGGAIQSLNVLQLAGQNGLPSAVNPVIQKELSAINGVASTGLLIPSTTDPTTSSFRWANASTTTIYFPTVKLDYNATDKLRISATFTEQKQRSPGTYAPNWEGLDTVDHTSYAGNNDIAGLSVEYSVSPTLFNNLHLGYLYQYSIFDPENLGLDYSKINIESWAYGTGIYGGSYPRRGIDSLYSMYDVSDSLTWQRGKHTIVAGFSGQREWDRYWNGAGGEADYYLGLSSYDPAYSVMTNAIAALPGGSNTSFQSGARNLYATLTGNIDGVYIGVGRPVDTTTHQYKPYGQYNLNEIQQSEGFWIQDRWRIRPDLTINYGLRWDVVGDDYDKDGAYTSAASLASVFGPTPVGAEFQPGNLGGFGDPSFTAGQHRYNTSWKNPEPAIALAWNPNVESGFLGKLLGGNKTVIRTGYSLRNYLDGNQNFWAFASNSGGFFYQQGSYVPDPTAYGTPGYFKAGSLYLGTPNPAPNYLLTPLTYASTVPGDQEFGQSEWIVNPNIRSPYIESWNLGIQRELPGGQALEVNYVGNLVLHTWLGLNLNEVNIFENGFLSEFKNAQGNLAINQANGKGNTPFNYGLAGQVALPILTAAYGTTNNSSWNGLYSNLVNGAAGSVASSLLSSKGPLCNLVGSKNFTPCAGTAGAGYPLNFLNINPYAQASGLNYLDAAGMSDYESLQIQYHTRLTHGAQFTANYTLAHSMVNGCVNCYQSTGYTPYTLRNLNLNYLDSSTDVRQLFRVYGTYDLPLGKGKAFLNYGGVVNAVLGGWTIGTITTIQTALPTTFGGGYATVQSHVTSGVNFLQGITAQQIQNSIQIQHTGACTSAGCNGWVQEFPNYLASNSEANPADFTPATTPGQFAQWPIIRGPMYWTSDASATKSVTIHERYNLTIQATATNVFNHPTIGLGSLSILSTSFGRATPSGNRAMALRANLVF